MLFSKKNRKVSVKQMQKWIDTKRMEKVVDLLQSGNYDTRMKAIEILATVNLIQVKNALLDCLDDKVRGVALKAAESIEIMGATPEERARIDRCRSHWAGVNPTLIKESNRDFIPGH